MNPVSAEPLSFSSADHGGSKDILAVDDQAEVVLYGVPRFATGADQSEPCWISAPVSSAIHVTGSILLSLIKFVPTHLRQFNRE